MSAFRKRSFAKAFSWRVIASTDTFLISLLITGKLTWAGTITILEILTKTFLYYLHERGWNKIKWGRI
tara:strand:- start:8 stop:211 length:204 start_codon:yes stop_codon:yes gene_type:complete